MILALTNLIYKCKVIYNIYIINEHLIYTMFESLKNEC